MTDTSKQLTLHDRLNIAAKAMSKKQTHEHIPSLFKQVCDEIVDSFHQSKRTTEFMKNIVMMQRIAAGPSPCPHNPEYIEAFVEICGVAAQELILKDETRLSDYMARVAYGLDLYNQPTHYSNPDRNPTPNKPVNNNTNKLNWS